MSFPLLPRQQQVSVAPIHKTMVSCCGYQCGQGVPAAWECPGCHTVHTEHIPPELEEPPA